jgi:ATP adenylyltransferase
VPLDELWAGWRSEYVSSAATSKDGEGDRGCVFCRLLTSDEPDAETFVVWRGATCAALLNAYPYTSGHLLVLPIRHVGELDQLDTDESAELGSAVTAAVAGLQRAYAPDGVNVGANLGRAAGAGVPGHLHLHALPRWSGDTNFMTTVASVRVQPEALPTTWSKLRDAWP